MSLAVKYWAICAGNSRMLMAKMIGITPAIVTFRGRYCVWPWYMRRPRTRLAYWTGIRRWPSLMKTTPAMTMIPMMMNGTIRSRPSGPLTTPPAWCGMRPTMPAKMMKLMPLPRPRSLMSSPSHMSRMVPAVQLSSSDSVSKLKNGFCGITPLAASSTLKP